MDHWSRRQFVQGAGAVGLALAAGCMQAKDTPRAARIGILTSFTVVADSHCSAYLALV